MRCQKIPLLLTADFTFESGQLSIWSAAEIATTIMAASIPVLRLWVKTIVSVHSRYRLSSADRTFNGRGVLQGHGQRSKMTTLATTTTITSGGNNMVRKSSSKRGRAKLADMGWASRSSSDSEDLEAFGSPAGGISGGAAGGIVKMETITVNYDKRTASMID